MRKLIGIAVPAAAVASLLAMALVEGWVRSTWDERRGTPGFFLSDAARGQRLAAGYDGWFAGVPVRINQLGFRDEREYSAAKPPGTFRIVVLGDSVTFGHGATYETTYPFLLEERLKAWRPGTTWQVWNLGVPGYNTRQELTYLHEIGPRFEPDLVVIGFFRNDLTDNDVAGGEPGVVRRTVTPVVRLFQRHLYSFEFYKRAYLTARWRLATGGQFRQQLDHLRVEQQLLDRGSLVDAPEQRLTPVDVFDEDSVRTFVCIGAPKVDETRPGELAERIWARAPELVPWLDAVSELQQMARAGTYRLAFFINAAPESCHDQDRFYNGGSLADDRVLLDVLGRGTPVASSARAFLRYRPSQMPLAAGHSLGNANVVKANVLFEFLRDHVLPQLVDRPSVP